MEIEANHTAVRHLREQVLAAAAAGTPLRVCGGGSKDWYGQPPSGTPLEVGAYAGVVDYDPSELVITARCGTPLAEIEALLAASGQMLPFEPPHFGPLATWGGMLACGLSGPRRASAGALRDFVLGTVLLDGKGDLLRFGGQVMKNVAGYDVSRMLAGSMGMLGVVLEASLKVLPAPPEETTLCFEMGQGGALDCLNRWAGQPLPISASAWCGGQLWLRLSGAGAAVAAARATLGGDAVADGGALWLALREHRHPFFAEPPDLATPGVAVLVGARADVGVSDDGAAGCGHISGDALWRLALPSTTPPLDLDGQQLVEWGGGQRWLLLAGGLAGDAMEQAAKIRAAALAAGGHATLFRGGDKRVGVFQPLNPALDKIHRKLKAAFDPAGIFNPGRMYSGL